MTDTQRLAAARAGLRALVRAVDAISATKTEDDDARGIVCAALADATITDVDHVDDPDRAARATYLATALRAVVDDVCLAMEPS